MAPQLGNYVLETATAPGTGSFTLNGPETDRRSFSTAFPNGGSVFYFADDGSSAEWGVGTLTIGTPSTLSRTTIIGTTSGGTSALNFSGSVEVYNEIPAEYVPVLEQDGSLTLAGSLTVRGKTLVQNVADFTSQEAIPAAQADRRYVKGGASSYDFTPEYAGVNRSSGEIWLNYKDDKGVDQYAFAQPAGDYATNPALNTETTNRTNADTNLQNQINNRVLKTGDTMTGHLWNTNWISAGANGGWNGARTNTGDYSWTNGIEVGNPINTGGYRASMQVTDVYLDGGANTAGINFTGYDAAANVHQYYLAWNGNIQTPKGLVAFTSDLPFTDQNLRVQVFNAIASDGAFVTLPLAFRTLVGVTAQQHSSGREGIRPIRIETNVFRGDGFNVSIWSEGGGIQYTFVAYGYL